MSTVSCERIHNEVHKCTKYGLPTPTAARLKRHMETHDPNRGIKCDVCPHVSANAKALETHIKKLHRKGRHSARCDICTKPCATKESLYMHMKYNHKDQDNHKDQMLVCEEPTFRQRFFQKNKFDNHVKQHQVEKEVKDEGSVNKTVKYECLTCKRLFISIASLKDHEMTRNKVNRFQCLECHMGFKRKYSLKRHKEIHSKMKATQVLITNRCNSLFFQ